MDEKLSFVEELEAERVANQQAKEDQLMEILANGGDVLSEFYSEREIAVRTRAAASDPTSRPFCWRSTLVIPARWRLTMCVADLRKASELHVYYNILERL